MSVNVYQMVTDRIIAQLNEGIIPWEKPWTGIADGAFNRITRKSYSLLNQILLGKPGEYATFDQWKKLGGRIKKGEKASFVVFWKMISAKTKENDENSDENGELKDEEKKEKLVPILRYYNVFHISQVEGVEPLKEPIKEHEPISEAEEVLENYVLRESVKFHEIESNDAFYRPYDDTVVVPLKGQFSDIEEYYGTAFHELVHSTGHPKRLNRINLDDVAAFGSESYSKEELVAEVGSAALMNMLGLETKHSIRNNAGYIQSWLQVLKNDCHFVVSATSKASKAVELILGDTLEKTKNKEKDNMKENKTEEVEEKVEEKKEEIIKEKVENNTETKNEEVKEVKKKKRTHAEIIIDRCLSRLKKKSDKDDGYSIMNFEMNDYYCFSDTYMILGDKNNDFGHSERKNPFKWDKLFKPLEFCGEDKMEKIEVDIGFLKKFKKEVKEDKKPYIVSTKKGKVGVDPSFLIDMLEFIGDNKFKIGEMMLEDDESKYKDGHYTGLIYFRNNNSEIDRIGAICPVHI